MKTRNGWKRSSEKQILYQKGNGYVYRDQKYSEKDWFCRLSNFAVLDENQCKLKIRGEFHSTAYIRTMFSKNILKSSFSALILPCIVFSTLSLIVFLGITSYQINRNFAFAFENDMMRGFYLLLAILFAGLGVVLFIKSVVLKQKCYYTNCHGGRGYLTLSRSEYTRMMKLFKLHEAKESIFFAKIFLSRIIIRELIEFDALDYYEMASNIHVAKYMGWEAHKNIQESIDLIQKARAEYAKGLIYRLAIEDKLENKVIGYIGLSRYDLSQTTCQIVYAISEAYWGKGYAKEAVIGFIERLKDMGKTTIYASHVQENVASGKVLIHCGFIRDPHRDTKMMIHEEEKNIISYILEERKENS